MSLLEIFALAVGLSMDAFAVAVCAGLGMRRASIKNMLTVGLYFGVFQAVMPLLGYAAGALFADVINVYAHWVAFVLLMILGGKMILGSFKKEKQEKNCSGKKETSLKPLQMIPLALATSIDALAVGVSFAFLQVNIVPAVSMIGIATLFISMAGVKIGNAFGVRFKSKAEIAGGIILLLIGLKIVISA